MAAYNQAQWAAMLNDPVGLQQFLRDWAAGGQATHSVTGAGDKGESSYEQALADAAANGVDTSTLAQTYTAPPAAGVGTPDPGYDAYYQNALRQIGTDRDAQLATNDYSRFLAQQRGTRALGDLSQQWNTQREQLPADYIRRGVLNSGMYRHGLQDYGAKRMSAEGNATDLYNQTLRQYDLTADELRRKSQQQTLDLEGQRQARYQGTSAKLAAAQPYTV